MRQCNKEYGSEVRKRIYDVVVTYIHEHGYPPTVREIGSVVNLSPSPVHANLKKMIETGMLETDAGVGSPRAIRVPGHKFVGGDRHGNQND